MAHKHAALMMEYAKDAATCENPCLHWQYRHDGSTEWEDFTGSSHPSWSIGTFYRRKPRTILINGREVAEPLRVAPDLGTHYYTIDPALEKMIRNWSWCNDDMDNQCLKLGIIHMNEHAAIAHAKALMSFTTTVE
jgi:hypothetical protein